MTQSVPEIVLEVVCRTEDSYSRGLRRSRRL
jgi:hypothetical protein